MKNYLFALLLMAFSSQLIAYNVTFRVDMSQVIGQFTTPAVNGTFNGWCGNCAQMSDNDGDNIWEISIELVAGSYEYQFSADNWTIIESQTAGEPCTVTNGGFTNRFLSVTENTILPIVCWNKCVTCEEALPAIRSVTFQVDMSNISGFTSPEVNGTFNNWCGGCNPMLDSDGDNIWTTTISIQSGIHQFKFAYDNWLSQENFTPGTPCTIIDNGAVNRLLNVESDTTLQVYCWNFCSSCDAIGCMDSTACNFSPDATSMNNSCTYPGCMDMMACNFNPNAGCPNESCTYPGCNDAQACNYSPLAFCSDGSCLYPGCTDSQACNFNANAGCENGTCHYLAEPCEDGISSTMLDIHNADCNCIGIPFDYGFIESTDINACINEPAQSIQAMSPLNITDYEAQWYYTDGIVPCPDGNNTSGWSLIPDAVEFSFTPEIMLGSRTFACMISPASTYAIPISWSGGCKVISYFTLEAQTITGNPNATPFTLLAYAVNSTPGNSYEWTATNGVITSGQGTNAVSVLWGQSGPFQISLIESNGICSDASSLLVVNSECAMSVLAVPENAEGICNGTTNTISAISSVPNVSYQWYYETTLIPGATGNSIDVSEGGNYQVITTQGNCNAASQIVSLINYPATNLPEITTSSTTPGCSGGSIIIAAEGGTFDSYLWNTGATSASIEVTTSGEYSIDLADANGCHATAGPINVNFALQEPLPICIVSVDPTTNNNVIVWEPLPSEVTSAYAIFKETNVADEYENIGTITYGQDGIFEDVNSNAAVQAGRYKLALIDTCGIESFLTPHHKTIHLTSNIGLNNTVNLIWSHYEGFPFGSYSIYRGTDANNLTLLTSIASNLNSYTDLSPLSDQAYYVIEVEGISCDPTREIIVSRSNVINLSPDAIFENPGNAYRVIPNPTSGISRVKIANNASADCLVMTDIAGSIINRQTIFSNQENLDLTAYAPGIYLLHFVKETHIVFTIKLVKQ